MVNPLQYGTEPQVIVAIEWPDGTKYYGERTQVIGAITVEGRLVQSSSISNTQKANNANQFGSASITLDDSDGLLKHRFNTEQLASKTCRIYHHFLGSGTTLTLLMKGRIAGDVLWGEGDRNLTFDIEHYIEDQKVGFAPTLTDLPSLSADAVGKPWPLCFGTVLKVPAVPIYKDQRTVVVLSNEQQPMVIQVSDSGAFPQGTPIHLRIGGIEYIGAFSGNLFFATDRNVAIETALPLDDRPDDDPDKANTSVVWLQEYRNIVAQYCMVVYTSGVETHYLVNFCSRQLGKKCYFTKAWETITPLGNTDYTSIGVLLNSAHTIAETAGHPRSAWDDTYWSKTGLFDPLSPDLNIIPNYTIPTWNGCTVVRDGYKINTGGPVIWTTAQTSTYICNLLPSYEILEVYAWRTYCDSRIFTPVPSSYYDKHLSFSIAGRYVTAITFDYPLSNRVSEQWEDQIFVSLRSSRGPNAADIIKYLIQEYSDQDIDATTFTAVRLKIMKFWANFAVFDQPNVMELCERIAWESRCALIQRAGDIGIKYLAEVPVEDLEIDEVLTELKTMKLGSTPLDDVKTKITNKWKTDYSGGGIQTYKYVDSRWQTNVFTFDAPMSYFPVSILWTVEWQRDYKMIVDREYTYENNVATYGLKEEEHDWLIYNIELFVKISAGFWGNRLSNLWRRIESNTFLEALSLAAFSAVKYDIAEFSGNKILGVISNHTHDINHPPVITIESILASKIGISSDNQPTQDDTYWLGDPAYPTNMAIPTNLDPGTGREEIDYFVNFCGDSGGDNPNQPPPENEYAIMFKKYPADVTRGQEFELEIWVIDETGNPVNEDFVGLLELVDTDGADVLGDGSVGVSKAANIQLLGGVWYANSLRIDLGSGMDTGSFRVVVNDIAPLAGNDFPIHDELTTSYYWAYCPCAGIDPCDVVRNEDFQVGIGGGAPNDHVTVGLLTMDSKDCLYIDGVNMGRLFSLTLDGSGNYNSNNWSIRGGSLEGGVASLIVSDDDGIINDATCGPFELNGLPFGILQNAFTLTQELLGNNPTCELYKTGTVGPGQLFELGVEVFDTYGDVLTTYSGYGRLTCQDADGNIIGILDAGEDALNYVLYAMVPIVNGEWSYDQFSIDITGAETDPLVFHIDILVDDTWIQDDLSVNIQVISFVVSTVPNTARASNFAVRIQALNSNGEFETDYVPGGEIDIIFTGSDILDEIAPIVTDETGWVDGAKEVTCQITGGAGSDNGNIQVRDPDTGRTGNTDLAIAASLSEFNILAGGYYYGSGNAGDADPPFEPVDCTGEANNLWDEMQTDAYLAFSADNVLGGGGIGRNVRDSFSYFCGSASIAGGYTKITIPPGDRIGLKLAKLYCSAYAVRRYNVSYPLKSIVYMWSPIVNNFELRIKMSESAALYNSGAALAGMSGFDSVPFAWINNESIRRGGTPSLYTPAIEIPLDPDFIEAMVGNDLYIWFYIEGTLVPYEDDFCNCDSTFGVGTDCGEFVQVTSTGWPSYDFKVRLYR